MIAMTMGKQYVGCASDSLGPLCGREHRIAVKPRVNQKHCVFNLDPKTGMAQPGDFHDALSVADGGVFFALQRGNSHLLAQARTAQGLAAWGGEG